MPKLHDSFKHHILCKYKKHSNLWAVLPKIKSVLCDPEIPLLDVYLKEPKAGT